MAEGVVHHWRHGWIPIDGVPSAPDSPAVAQDAASVAGTLAAKAAAVEPKLTALVSNMVGRRGGRMEGLDFRLKSHASLQRKIEAQAKDQEISPQEVADKLFDVNRYTGVFNDKTYATSAEAVLASLRSQGYKTNVKNYWTKTDNPYQGINVQVTAPDGGHEQTPDWTEPAAYGFDAVLDDEATAVEFAARLPKTLQFRATALYGFEGAPGSGSTSRMFGCVFHQSKLAADGVNGGRNETAIARYRRIIAACERAGITVQYDANYASNSYPSREAFESAIGV